MIEHEETVVMTWPTQLEAHSWDERMAEDWTETLKARGFRARLARPGEHYVAPEAYGFGCGVMVFLTPHQAKALAGDKQSIEVTEGDRFTVTGVPEGHRIYGVLIGDDRLGAVQVMRRQLDQPVTLGLAGDGTGE